MSLLKNAEKSIPRRYSKSNAKFKKLTFRVYLLEIVFESSQQ